jgi:hypothetical protein
MFTNIYQADAVGFLKQPSYLEGVLNFFFVLEFVKFLLCYIVLGCPALSCSALVWRALFCYSAKYQ